MSGTSIELRPECRKELASFSSMESGNQAIAAAAPVTRVLIV